MDEDNFKFEVDGFEVEMTDGVLTISGCDYQEDEADPTYSFVRHIAFLKGLLK